MEWLTKYIHVKPSKGTMTAEDMAHQFLEAIVSNHGVPKRITLDRDKLFMIRFWMTLTNLMGIDHWLTTAYHPQGNGQTEWTNQMIKQYLQHYVNYEQNNWVTFLPMAQFAFNNAVYTTTGEMPFYVNYGYHPSITGEKWQNKSISDKVEKKIKKLKNLHK